MTNRENEHLHARIRHKNEQINRLEERLEATRVALRNCGASARELAEENETLREAFKVSQWGWTDEQLDGYLADFKRLGNG